MRGKPRWGTFWTKEKDIEKPPEQFVSIWILD